jgi:hypothetical protein
VVLGAGFSKAVSSTFPLTDDLGNRALAMAGIDRADSFRDGRFESWLSQLAEPQPYLNQAENTSNLATFERLVQALHVVMCDVEQEVVSNGLPSWLFRLVTAMHARRATVVTFNYDRVVERAIAELGLEDLERPDGEQVVSWTDAIGDVPSYPPIPARLTGGSRETIRLLKLHGSLNWYWVPGDSTGATLHHWELEDDNAGRARYLPGREPFLVPPAATKSAYFQNPIMRETWRRAAAALREADSVAFVGYSFPAADLLGAGMFADTLQRQVDEIVAVNITPDPVIEAIRRLTGNDASTCRAVTDFVHLYVARASNALVSYCLAEGDRVPSDTLLLVGWNNELLARVIDIDRENGSVVVVVDDYDDAVPTAPVPDGSSRRPARRLSDLIGLLRGADTVRAHFANGATSDLVGIEPLRTTSGASVDWQVLTPADRPAEVGATSWRQKRGLDER